MTALLCAISALLGYQVITLIANYAYWLRRAPACGPPVELSVLIPARDELHNLPTLLTALQSQTLKPCEILVCDDGSTDGMTQWLEENAQALGTEWFASAPRPDDWTGKNWACKQLADRSRGEWILFLDADVRPESGFLERVAGWCGAGISRLVTAFPRILPAGVGDALLINMVPWAVGTILPLKLSERPRTPAFAVANGQIMAFSREFYRECEPHVRTRATILEDVEIARMLKREGQRVYIGDAGDVLSVRMYRNLSEALDGFSKNSVAMCGGKRQALLWAAGLAFAHLLPLVLAIIGHPIAWALVAVSAVLYGLVASASGLPLWYGVLYPVAIVLSVWVLLRSVWWHLMGRVRWKGRVYASPQKGAEPLGTGGGPPD